MIRFRSERVEKEWTRAPVALRLVTEALDLEAGGVQMVFRVRAPEKFENGIHARGLALDIELSCTEVAAVKIASRVNARFRTRALDLVCTSKVNLSNFPSGARRDRPHVHVQIPAVWESDPRAFLREFGFLGVDT